MSRKTKTGERKKTTRQIIYDRVYKRGKAQEIQTLMGF
jgi:hypothetical protein